MSEQTDSQTGAQATTQTGTQTGIQAGAHTDQQLQAAIKYSRGAQLRALVMSWQLGETYQRTLQIQAEALQSGELLINEDWGEVAEQLLAQVVASQ